MSYERGINVNVRDLRECIEGLPDDMDVIIPVCIDGDENTILSFKHARTVGVVSNPMEEKSALCIAIARDGADMYTLMELNERKNTICEKLLF